MSDDRLGDCREEIALNKSQRSQPCFVLNPHNVECYFCDVRVERGGGKLPPGVSQLLD